MYYYCNVGIALYITTHLNEKEKYPFMVKNNTNNQCIVLEQDRTISFVMYVSRDMQDNVSVG